MTTAHKQNLSMNPATQDEIAAYKRLVRRVRKLNKPLSLYLANTAPSLPHFYYDGDLRNCFTWSWTAHGKHQWDTVFFSLVEADYYHKRQVAGKITYHIIKSV